MNYVFDEIVLVFSEKKLMLVPRLLLSIMVYFALSQTFNRTINEYEWEMILQQHDPRCHSPQDRCAATLGIDTQQFCAIDTGNVMDT